MKILIDIDPNLYTRLYDNGTELSHEDAELLATTVRNGEPYDEPYYCSFDPAMWI